MIEIWNDPGTWDYDVNPSGSVEIFDYMTGETLHTIPQYLVPNGAEHLPGLDGLYAL